LILGGFCLVKFTRVTELFDKSVVPYGHLNRAEVIEYTDEPVAKPKVKRVVHGGISGFSRKSHQGLEFTRAAAKRVFLTPAKKAGAMVWHQKVELDFAVEFFDSRSEQRKICYVVDCSGSMKGTFGRVRERLKKSAGTLAADQYFNIIFFGDGNIREFAEGRLVRAGERARKQAFDFIDSVKAAGRTNAMEALERAFQIRDADGSAAEAIYFLTDGFELDETDADGFALQVLAMLARHCPGTKINTIGFWPGEKDRRILEMIAIHSGGEFKFIGDGVNF